MKITYKMKQEACDVLEKYKRQVFKENVEHYNTFTNLINKLIMETPSKDLRNELTSLNILFNTILANNRDLI